MVSDIELKVNKKCKGQFCEWRGCLQLQIEMVGEILSKPVHCENCSMWVE